jgi:NADH-quinone oxidoreductase subunit L
MQPLIALEIAAPLAGFLVLVSGGRRLPHRAVAWVGVLSVATAAACALALAVMFLRGPRAPVDVVLWRWFAVGGLRPAVGLRLDGLSLLMTAVVSGVSLLIHVYSVEFMRGDDGYARFFAYMNLFVASMLLLVLGSNLLVLYAGWEGVGLCSYLLIGFWYRDAVNVDAAMKAFVVTRIGDAAMAVALFLLFLELGTLDIASLMTQATARWPVGTALPVAASVLLLAGAVGKSAQLPLQTWLPDAMAGPTPTSALIHAATMVTAGVYLIARTRALFVLAPGVLTLVAAIGAVTLLLSGAAALTQRDIKRVLAYSTISQVGYMFLALGVGAWTAAMFHFMTHAFFKALLFLAAGLVIKALHHEHDIFRMGGLRRELPLVFWTFVIGAASLSGVPLVTAGFYSKDLILSGAFASPYGVWLCAAGVVGVVLTALYSTRVVCVVFFGEPATQPSKGFGPLSAVPVVTLAVLALVGGLVQLPGDLGGVHLFADALGFPRPVALGTATEASLQGVSALATLLGIACAGFLYLRRREALEAWAKKPLWSALHRLLAAGWGFDVVYDVAFVRPYRWLARLDPGDLIDRPVRGIARFASGLNALLVRSQTGNLRWYAAAVALGAVLLVALAFEG